MSSNLEGSEMLRETAVQLRSLRWSKGFVCMLVEYDIWPGDPDWPISRRRELCVELREFVTEAEPVVGKMSQHNAWLTTLAFRWDFHAACLHWQNANSFRAAVLEEIVRGCRPEELRERLEARRFEIEALAEEEPN